MDKMIKYAKFIFDAPVTDWKEVSKVTKGVYALINTVNAKCYIGSSVSLFNRIVDYYQNWYVNDNPNLLIYKAIKKYGIAVFSVAVL